MQKKPRGEKLEPATYWTTAEEKAASQKEAKRRGMTGSQLVRLAVKDEIKRGGAVSARDLDGLWQIVEREREWRLQDSECGGDEIRESVGRLRREWDEATSSLRTIPADRVLGEGMVAVKWVSVNEALPEDGQTVGFVTECANDKWYHGRVLGGRYAAGEFGGFSVPGLMVQASHWFAFPPLPDALRANQGGAAT